MAQSFEDVRMVELNERASAPSGEGALMNIVIRLNQTVPPGWADAFQRMWKDHIYMMKRRAIVSGDSLTIVCMPDELQKDHIPELNRVFGEVNAAYRSYRADLEREKQAREEERKRQQHELANLKGRLKFD
jgi:hypothetical protein